MFTAVRHQGVVARIPIHATLYGIDQQSAMLASLGHQFGEVLFWRAWALGFPVGYELHRPEQTQTPDVADTIQVA